VLKSESVQFRCATMKNRTDILRRQTRDTADRVPFIVQYFPGAEKLCHLLRSLQHVIDDDEHHAKAIPTPPLLAFKQPPNLKQTIVGSKLPSLQENSDHNTYNPASAIFARHAGSSTRRPPSRYHPPGTGNIHVWLGQHCLSHTLQKRMSEAWYIGETMQTLRQRMNRHCAMITRQECSLPVGEHFSSEGHSASDLRVSVLQGGLQNTQQRKIAEQKLITKFRTHQDGLNRDLGFMSHYANALETL